MVYSPTKIPFDMIYLESFAIGPRRIVTRIISRLEPILAIYFSRHQAVCRSKCCLWTLIERNYSVKEQAMQLVERLKFETVLPDFWGPNRSPSHATGNSCIAPLVDKQSGSVSITHRLP